MSPRSYSVGDRVIAIREYEGNNLIKGAHGTVLFYDAVNERYAVEYDEYVEGHTCDNECGHGYGWYTAESCLEPEPVQELAPHMTYEELMI